MPVIEVPVQWTEIPGEAMALAVCLYIYFATAIGIAGSKIRFTSILHMAWELFVMFLAYSVLGVWTVRSQVEKISPDPNV